MSTRWPLRLIVALLLLACAASPAAAAPETQLPAPGPSRSNGQMTWAVHTTLVPAWFDPADTTIVSFFMVLYALHDAVVKPMPGKAIAPSLAESWSASADGLAYDFVLRKGVKFHNGEPVTADDVKFSFERYRGLHARTFKDRVLAVETPDAHRVRIRLKHENSARYFQCATHALIREGTLQGVCVLARDITIERENEARFKDLFETLGRLPRPSEIGA